MDITAQVTDSRAALDELIANAEAAESNWTTPRAPGKWSPQQVTEHVAIVLEEAAHLVDQRPAKFPNFPFFLRPILRGMVFKKAVKTGDFPKAKTFKAFDPPSGPETPAAARERLDSAHQKFQEACTACAHAEGMVKSSVFGAVSLSDYIRFTALHTRHHAKQIPTA